MLQRQPSSITTASPFYFTSTAMQQSTWSYTLTHSTRLLVREPLVIARYPLVNYCTQSVSLSMLSACWFFFSMLSACQRGIRSLVSYPLVNTLSVHYGLQSVRYIGPKIWELVPNNIKYCDSLSKFRKLIKSWRLESCPCRLCKTYIAHLGFI